MRHTSQTALLVLSMMLPIAGCAVVTPDKRFPDVQRDVDGRLDQHVAWSQEGPEDQRADDAVAALMARPLGADDAVQIALLMNRGLQATFEELGIAQADVVQAGQLRNPDIAGFFRIPDSPPKSVNWNIGVDIWLFDAFLVPIREKLSGAAEEQAIQQVTNQVLRLAADTRAAYYTCQADTMAASAQEELAETARLTSDLSRDQAGSGNVDDLRLAEERAAFQQTKLALIQARSMGLASRERLRQLMGLSDQPVNWSLAAEAPLPRSAEPDEEELVALALGSRLDLASALAEVQRQEYALELSKKWWLSTVQVGAETEQSTDGQFTTGPHFSAEIPIFNQRQGELARQESIIRQAKHRVSSLQAQVRTEIRTGLDRVAAARQVVELYRDEMLPLRRQVFAGIQNRFNSMFVGVFDVLNAKSDLTTAETSFIRALQDYWMARSDLELALGTRVPDVPLPSAASPPPENSPPTPSPTVPTSPNPHQQHQPK